MTTLPLPCACLVVLDGWGLADPGPGNAVSLARTPVFDELWGSYPHTTLTASGRAVGLPEGQMGNSEVGHLNLGAGAVIRQDLTRINDAVLDGVLSENPAIVHALTCSERVHLIGLVSDGGVHSSLGHLQALLELAGRLSVRDLVIHCFTDGRDTPPESGIEHVALLERWCLELWPPGRSRETRASGAADRRRVPVGPRSPAGCASARSSAAGTRWTATVAGSASRLPTTCSSTAAPPTTRRPACRPCSTPTSGGRPTSSSPPPRSATRP